MINNLFRIFDPSNSFKNYIWYGIIIPIIAIISKRKLNQRSNLYLKNIKNKLIKEVELIIGPKVNKNTTIIFMNTFFILIIVNLYAIRPFNFTISAHISISLPFAIIIWMRPILYSFINKNKKFFIHLTPINTPSKLINFIVIIETIRIVIRPLTLSIRLSANIIAGHLIMSLISNNSIASTHESFLNIAPTLILIRLELAVRIIQAYVFITLTSLYYKENI